MCLSVSQRCAYGVLNEGHVEMSTADQTNHSSLHNMSLGPTFRRFSRTERLSMLREDRSAGFSVSCILLAIVTGGMLMMLYTVLATM